MDLKTYLEEKRKAIDQALQSYLDVRPGAGRLARAMGHSLFAGGKRLRAVLCLAAAEAVGEDGAAVMPAACALEMIHTYSLIHDDLPAMDDDALRRGKPTCHVAFDEATAILAGDALLTLAFQILAATAAVETAHRQLAAIGIIARAAGFEGMIEGQMRDMEAEGRALEPDALEGVHALKTGALIEASVWAGALLAGGSDAEIEALRRYARAIGLAFQVTDDILNVEGDEEMMGKAVGSDTRRSKSTYPALLGLPASKALAETLKRNALRALANFDNRTDPLRALAAYVVTRKR